MPKRKNEPKPNKVRRLNLKGLLIFGGTIIALVIAYFPINYYTNQQVRKSALEQAKEIQDKGDLDLAIRHLDRYVATWPDDIKALEPLAKLRADFARSSDEVIRAAQLNDQLLRLDPDGKKQSDCQETRRRLVRMWIRQGELIRDYAIFKRNSRVEADESRYRAALTVADQLVNGFRDPADAGKKKEDQKILVPGVGDTDAESHRLLAQALEGLVAMGDQGSRARMEEEYQKALRLQPGDATSAERLALMQLRLKAGQGSGGAQGMAQAPAKSPEEAKALQTATATMDALLKGGRDSVEIRLARYRFFDRINKPAERKAELDAALALKGDDPRLGLLAASDAIRRNDRADARARLDALPKEIQDDLQARYLRGQLEYAEQHPDEAIEQWRKGLSAVGGSDLRLTFDLAHLLIRLNRLSEARPLVNQFQRLESDESKVLGRYLQGLFEQRAGHPARAIENLVRAQDKLPDGFQGELQLALGKCYEAIGDVGRATTAYRRSSIASPGFSMPRLAIAQLLSSRNPDEAGKEIDQALIDNPADPVLLLAAARLELSRQAALPVGDRRWQRLEEILGRASQVAPNEFAFSTIRVDYLSATGRDAQAADLLEKLARGPGRRRPEAWIAWALTFERQGKLDVALRTLDEASSPEAAGDHVPLRVARAMFLARQGKGQAAREALTTGRDRIPKSEQPDLSRALGNLCREMGDRDAARNAFLEWSRLVPDSPEPAFALLNLAQVAGDTEAARLGSEVLRGIGGDSEPYGLAAQALDLLRSDPARPGPPPPEKLALAERLLDSLQAAAPQLSIGHLLRGSLLEYRDQLEAAAKEYDLARKDPGMPQALVGLVGVLTKLKKYDELAKLQKEYENSTTPGKRSENAVGFDQISAIAALRAGDKGRAEGYVARIVEQRPDSLEARSNLARLLDEMGKPREAEAALQSLVDRRPFDPAAWVALFTFQALRGQPGDASKTIELARTKFKGERLELLIARCHWVAGDLSKAESDFAAALAKRPEDPITLHEVGNFYSAIGKVAEFESVLRRATKLNPAPPWASRELALLLSTRNEPTAWSEAWSLVEPGSKTSSESPEDRMLRATVLARSPDIRRRAEAAPAMVALARDLPASNSIAIEARVRLAQALLDSNQPAEAEAFIAPLANDYSRTDPTALAISAQALARSGKAVEANSRLARLVSIEPKSPRVSSVKAWILAAEGKTSEAILAIASAIAELDNSPVGEQFALSFFDQAKKIGTSKMLEPLATKLAARWPRDGYLLSQVQLDQGKVDEALASARAALEAGSPREALRVATDLAVTRRDDPSILKEVDSLAELARSKAPKVFDIVLLQAMVRHLQERYEEEIAFYREAQTLSPPSVMFLNNMAWSLSEALRKPEEGILCIDEAIKRVGPGSQLLDTRGVILARLGRLNEAIADLERSVKIDPSPTTYFHLARTYFKAGKAEDYRRCRELARQKKFNPSTLDPTDRTDLEEVMLKNP